MSVYRCFTEKREGLDAEADGKSEDWLLMFKNETQYTDPEGRPSMHISINPNGSDMAVEGLFSPDGRVFGKMGHTERFGKLTGINIYGVKHQPVFESGIGYFL